MTEVSSQAIGERHRALSDLLALEGLVAFLATSPSGIHYLSGYWSQSSLQGFSAVLIVPDKAPLLLHPRLETEAAKRIPPLFHTRAWTDEQGPAEAVAEFVAEGTSAGPLAVEERHLTVVFERVIRAAGRAVVPAGRLLDTLRLCKDAVEVESARRSAAQLDAVFRRALALPFAGRSELELQLDIERDLRLAGSEAWSVLVLGGPNSAVPRARPGTRLFEQGDVVLVDIAASFGRMWSDITRCGCVGVVDEHAERAWAVLRQATEAGILASRAGRSIGGVDEATRAVIEEAGYGAAIVHRTGHGLGLDVIEPPSVSLENRAPVEPGMLLTVEPGLYFPGQFGLRLEESLHISAHGPEILTRISSELAIVG